MKLINITQHPIRIRVNAENKAATPDPSDILLDPSGVVARVSSSQTQTRYASGIPVVKTVFGEPENLPDPEEGVIYVGSTPMAQKASLMGRNDVVSPNTAPKQDIRDGDGHTYAVFNFQEF